jgi:putative ubiquitin-RnfH superfamily antitoxin RatB of RatAB toxin-antitoxin module
MSETSIKRCVVAYATREKQFLWNVELPVEATIADALAKAREHAPGENVPWESAEVGIFGELRSRDAIPTEGDRIEIYRPLINDPRERRRQRVRQLRGSSTVG